MSNKETDTAWRDPVSDTDSTVSSAHTVEDISLRPPPFPPGTLVQPVNPVLPAGRGRGRGFVQPQLQVQVDVHPAPHVDPLIDIFDNLNVEDQVAPPVLPVLQHIEEDVAGDIMAERIAELEAQIARLTQNKRGVSVSVFEEPSASMSAELWLSNVERQQRVLNESDEAMLNAALYSLKGKAGIWREKMELTGAPELTDFKVFKNSFLNRFGKDRSATDMLSLLKDVTQRPGESVKDFSDRLGVQLRTLANVLVKKLPQTLPPPTDDEAGRRLAAQHKTHRDDGFLQAFIDMQSLYFCSGLYKEYRQFMEPKFSEFDSYEKMLEKACDVERTVKSGSGGATPMAPISSNQDPQLETLMNEIKGLKTLTRNLQSGQGSRPANPAYSGSNSGATPKKSPPGPDLVKRAHLNAKIQKNTTQHRYCNKCRQWGRHITNECRANKTEIAALNPMDPAVPPSDSQPVSDWFWDSKPTTPPSGN